MVSSSMDLLSTSPVYFQMRTVLLNERILRFSLRYTSVIIVRCHGKPHKNVLSAKTKVPRTMGEDVGEEERGGVG